MFSGTSDLVSILTSFISKCGLRKYTSLFGTAVRVHLAYFVLFSGGCNFSVPL